MASFAAFAAGYLARPFGGIILSHYGDRYGRRRVFLWSLLVMSAATLGMGLVPTYAQWGVAATPVVVLLRLVQGFCLGGELPGALTYVVETAPRIAPFVCGVVFACVTMGVAVATGVSLSVRTLLDRRGRADLRLAHRVRPRRSRRRPQLHAAAFARGVARVRADARARRCGSRSVSCSALTRQCRRRLRVLAATGCFTGLFFSHLPAYLVRRPQVRSAPGRLLADGGRDVVHTAILFVGWLGDRVPPQLLLRAGAGSCSSLPIRFTRRSRRAR